MRGRWALLAVTLAVAGCVAPTALPDAQSPALPARATPGVVAAQARPTQLTRSAPGPPADVEAVSAPDLSSSVLDPIASPSATPPVLHAWEDGEGLPGVDVSRYQASVDWKGLVRAGNGFAYVKATEGTRHRSPTHHDQAAAARRAGLLQGAYHYARPDQSSGTLQARFFNAEGGSWTADGRTLPGALDLEFAESGDPCHGLSQPEMVAWVRDFSDEYRRLSGRIPVIYTKADVWDTCTGGDTSFADHPLWLFDHGEAPGRLPTGWDRPTLWQRGVVDQVDRNVFFGDRALLVEWASAPLR